MNDQTMIPFLIRTLHNLISVMKIDLFDGERLVISTEQDLRKMSLMSQKNLFVKINGDQTMVYAVLASFDEDTFKIVEEVCNKRKPKIITVDVFDEILCEWTNLNYWEKSVFVEQSAPDLSKKFAPKKSLEELLLSYFVE